MNDDFNKLSYLGFPHYSAVLGFGHTSKLNTLPPAVYFVKLITLRQSMISVAHININALLYNFRLYDKQICTQVAQNSVQVVNIINYCIIVMLQHFVLLVNMFYFGKKLIRI